MDSEKFGWASASEVVVAEATGIMANGLAVNESDREPSRSISALFEVVATAGAAVWMGPAVI